MRIVNIRAVFSLVFLLSFSISAFAVPVDANNDKEKVSPESIPYQERRPEHNPNYVDPKKNGGHIEGELLVKFKPRVAFSNAAVNSSKSIQAIKKLVKKGKLVIEPLARVNDIKDRQGRVVKKAKDLDINRWYRVALPADVDMEEVKKLFADDDNVQTVEHNLKISSFAVPNDSWFHLQFGMHNILQTDGVLDADIDAPEAWDVTTGSHDVIVAVLDTGIDYNHPDLINNIWTNPNEIPGNGIDDDNNGYIDDVNGAYFYTPNQNLTDATDEDGHGTHVSGIIGASGNNGIGVAGVNWNVQIMPLRILSGWCGISCPMDAMAYAINMGAKITNNSWGWMDVIGYSEFHQGMYDAISAANDAGVMFVAAAGNDGRDSDNWPVYPAGYDLPNVVSVASSRHNEQLSDWSVWGAESVDLAAPGQGIWSTVPMSIGEAKFEVGYYPFSGTSMAAPHVAGAAGLLSSAVPNINLPELKEWIFESVDVFPQYQGKVATGGRLNVNNALNAGYKLLVEPYAMSVNAGATVSGTLELHALSTFTGPVNLSVSTSDPRFNVNLSASTANPAINTVQNIDFTITADQALHGGPHAFTIIATDSNGNVEDVNTTLNAIAPDFSIMLSPENRSVYGQASRTITSTVDIQSILGLSGEITLSFESSTDLIQGSFSDPTPNLPADGSVTVDLIMELDPFLPQDFYFVWITATDGDATRSIRSRMYITRHSDLTVSDLQVRPVAGQEGVVEVNYELFNNGSGSTQQWPDMMLRATTGIYLSNDGQVNINDTLLASFDMSYMSSGEIRKSSPKVTLPASLPPGDYRIGVIVDTTNLVEESNENNNLRSQTITILDNQNDVDAQVTVLTPESSVSSGKFMDITSTVRNNGTNPLAAIDVNYYLSQDNVITTEDQLIATRSFASFAGSSEQSDTFSIAMPYPVGEYYIGAIADVANQVVESDEGNNVIASSVVNITNNVDLVIESLDVPSVIGVNDTFSVDFVGANQSNIHRSLDISWAVYLSDDADINQTDTLLYEVVSGSGAFPGLAGGESESRSVQVTLPQGTTAGQYYIGVYIDHSGSAAEENETNNTAAAPLTVLQNNIDLVVSAISPASMTQKQGYNASVTLTLTNQGTSLAENVAVDLYFSADNAITSADELHNSTTVTLNGGQSTNVNVSTNNLFKEIGTYYVGAIIDGNNLIAEVNENNNTSAAAELNIIEGVDLTPTSITATDFVTAGDTVSVSFTLENPTSASHLNSQYVLWGIYLSSDSNIVKGEDRLLYKANSNWSSERLRNITAGLVYNRTKTITIYSGILPGNYYIGVIADNTNTLKEANENNNTLAVPIVIDGTDKDAVVDSVSISSTVLKQGDPVQLTANVSNLGTAPLRDVKVSFYRSGDAVITTEDALLISTTLPLVSGGSSETVTLDYSFSNGAGDNYIGAVIDPDNTIVETNEANNSALGDMINLTLSPDLQVTSFSGSFKGLPGSNYNVSYTVKNQSGIATPAGFNTHIYLSADSVFDPAEDILLDSYAMGTLAALISITRTRTITIPVGYPESAAVLIAVADGDNSIAEKKENNNTRNKVFGVMYPTADVHVVSITAPSETSFYNGASVNIPVTIKNQGMSAASVTTSIYLSTDPVIDSNDVLVGSTASYVASNVSQNLSISAKLSADAGQYYLGAITDSANQYSETNEADNSMGLTATIGLLGKADLVATDYSVASQVGVSGQVAVDFNVLNQGESPAGANSSWQIYLSNDTNITNEDLLIDSGTTGNLTPGFSVTYNRVISLPPEVGVGQYYVGVIIDSGAQVSESDETNNVAYGSLAIVSADVDVLVSSVTISRNNISIIDPVILTANVSNLGSNILTAANLDFYLSSDALFDASDVLISSENISDLAANATADVTSTLNITLPGTYHVIAVADAANSVAERDENNNVATSTGTVLIHTGTDLSIVDLVAPTQAGTNGEFPVNFSLRNDGDKGFTMNPDRWSVYLSTDNVIDANDRLLLSESAYIGANTDMPYSAQISIPAQVTVGSYYLGVVADMNNDVAETNESNNVTVAPMDIVAYDVDAAVTDVTLGNPTISAGVPTGFVVNGTNLGSHVLDSASANVYLSTDDVFDAGDMHVGSGSLDNAIAAYKSFGISVNTDRIYPVPGVYRVIAVLDEEQAVAESNESNNIIVGPELEVTSGSDLIVSYISASPEADIGQTIVALFGFKNIGVDLVNAFTQWGMYLSTDTVLDGSDHVLHETQARNDGFIEGLTRIGAGQTVGVGKSVALPTSISAGQYYILIKADIHDDEHEGNEQNNVTASVIQIGESETVPQYTATELVGMVDASKLNDNGQVVGWIPPGADEWKHAGIWHNGVVTDLGIVGCRNTVSFCWSRGFAINNAGQVVGESTPVDTWPSPYSAPWAVYNGHSMLAENGTIDLIKTNGWEYGAAYDINESGVIVGYGRSVDWQNGMLGDYIDHGYVRFSDTNIVEFGVYSQASAAYAINESNMVVGEIADGLQTNAFQWEGAGTQILADLGGDYAVAKDVNDHRAVVGQSNTDTSAIRRAVRWDGYLVVNELGSLDISMTSSANAINNGGFAVGQSGGKAVLWNDLQVWDLNGRVINAGGVEFTEALDINNNNQILVRSGGKYYLLTPAN